MNPTVPGWMFGDQKSIAGVPAFLLVVEHALERRREQPLHLLAEHRQRTSRTGSNRDFFAHDPSTWPQERQCSRDLDSAPHREPRACPVQAASFNAATSRSQAYRVFDSRGVFDL
jgi:hypothetical protein